MPAGGGVMEIEAQFDRFSALSANGNPRFALRRDEMLPCVDDAARNGFDRHYVYHTAWAARVLASTKPSRHVDVSSCIYFASIASAFVPVDLYEFRATELKLDNLKTGSADLTNLPFDDQSIQSISCMHVVEHIGLGRYGDPLDPDGDLKAMAELQRVVAPGGSLLFVVPIGRPRIVFNAHRIYSFDQVCESFDELELKQFSLIPDGRFKLGLVIDATKELADQQNYGCGCFWFRRTS